MKRASLSLSLASDSLYRWFNIGVFFLSSNNPFPSLFSSGERVLSFPPFHEIRNRTKRVFPLPQWLYLPPSPSFRECSESRGAIFFSTLFSQHTHTAIVSFGDQVDRFSPYRGCLVPPFLSLSWRCFQKRMT